MSRTIFNCDEVLDAVKAAEGDLAKVFAISPKARDGPQGVKYADLICTAGGKSDRFNLRILGERHAGRIAPLEQVDCDKMNTESGGNFAPVTPRDRHPSLNFQKWPIKIETDDAGRPVGPLPSEDEASKYYQVCKHLDTFFRTHMLAQKKADMIVQAGEEDGAPAGALVIQSTKIVSLVQEKVGASSRTNPGAPLANPITRTNIKFEKPENGGGPARGLTILDKNKPTEGGNFEPLTFDDSPVTASNVHNIKSGTLVNGIIDMGSVCYSNMGISVPRDAKLLILELRANNTLTASDVFGDLAATPPAAPSASAAAAAPDDAGDSGDLDDVLDGLDE